MMPISAKQPFLVVCCGTGGSEAATARLEMSLAVRLAYMLAAIYLDFCPCPIIMYLLLVHKQPICSLSCTQAGSSAAGQAYIRRQLAVWQQSQWDSEAFEQHIHKERLLIYQMLAGHVEDVIPSLDLEWRRALGLFFW